MEAVMAVRVISHATNMTGEQYEGAIDQLGDMVKSFPGFVSHASWSDEDGVHVDEIWESREAFDAWYEAAVGPSMQQMQINVETQFQPIATLILRQG
jgi:heme-degrading monooxygenase HmoA